MTGMAHFQETDLISKPRQITICIIGWVNFLVLTFGMVKGLGSTFPILWVSALITSFGGVIYYLRLKKRIGKIDVRKISKAFTPYFMSTLIFIGFGIVLLITHFINRDG